MGLAVVERPIRDHLAGSDHDELRVDRANGPSHGISPTGDDLPDDFVAYFKHVVSFLGVAD